MTLALLRGHYCFPVKRKEQKIHESPSHHHHSPTCLCLLFACFRYVCLRPSRKSLHYFVTTMPWNTLCGFPPTRQKMTLRIPNGRWRPDTVITDTKGTEIFVLLDQTDEMRSYEAVFGDLDGRRLVCIKRHLLKAFWKDGYYFCTYRPNYKGQRPLREKDIDNKRLYPFSYLQVDPMKGRFYYKYFDDRDELGETRLFGENPWLGFMMVCCTPLLRWANFTCRFRAGKTKILVDQWRNVVEVKKGVDLLAALCMAYVFDRAQSQPMITVVGRDDQDDLASEGNDDFSLESDDDDDGYHEEGGGGGIAPPVEIHGGPVGSGGGRGNKATSSKQPPPQPWARQSPPASKQQHQQAYRDDSKPRPAWDTTTPSGDYDAGSVSPSVNTYVTATPSLAAESYRGYSDDQHAEYDYGTELQQLRQQQQQEQRNAANPVLLERDEDDDEEEIDLLTEPPQPNEIV